MSAAAVVVVVVFAIDVFPVAVVVTRMMEVTMAVTVAYAVDAVV